MIAWEELAIRLALALLLGGAIGLERQWRSRYVGLRTNTLVTIGSAAMTAFAMMLTKDDPTSIVHIVAGVIAGVGFLGAGVIIQEGMTVKGFSTAATLWCSVAVGLFAGAGYFSHAVVLAAFITLVNLFLRPIVYFINEKTAVQPHEDGARNTDDLEPSHSIQRRGGE
jgi:putative Mg2+ transporter-C (MgtC) family protein